MRIACCQFAPDVESPGASARRAREAIADAVACAGAAPGANHRRSFLVAVCDRCGSERGLEFEGGSVIAGPDGGLRAGPVEDRGTRTIVADCERGEALDKRTSEQNDAFADRRPAHYVHALLDVGVG